MAAFGAPHNEYPAAPPANISSIRRLGIIGQPLHARHNDRNMVGLERAPHPAQQII
jgi:hypothetical protein